MALKSGILLVALTLTFVRTLLAAPDVHELMRRFGDPGRISFRDGLAGVPNVVVSNACGSAEIALLGANVLAYASSDGTPVLFCPSKRLADYRVGQSVSGGIPVCWPQFSWRFMRNLPNHGFARKCVFDVRSVESEEKRTVVVLGLSDSEMMRKLWPYAFDLELTVTVSETLELTLRTRNTGSEPMPFSCGFHPYLRLGERDGTSIEGLEGLACVKALDDEKPGVCRGTLPLDRARDDVFSWKDTDRPPIRVTDAKNARVLELVSHGSEYVVVWNCGRDRQPSDFMENDWRRYVCIEPASDWPNGRTLAPGREYALTLCLRSVAIR